jgi:hypothetical protein
MVSVPLKLFNKSFARVCMFPMRAALFVNTHLDLNILTRRLESCNPYRNTHAFFANSELLIKDNASYLT